jgi:hypothetical protein
VSCKPTGIPVSRAKADGQTHPRQPGQVGADGEDVHQVHLQGVGCHFAHLEGRGRAHRPGQQVALGKRGLEIPADEAADLGGFAVVGVVVAGGEHVGAQDDAALDLVAEALGAALLVHVQQVLGVRRAVAVAHAVEAGQVGGGLGRGDEVVGGDGVLREPQVHGNGLGA